MRVRDLMQKDVISLQSDEPLINAVEATASERIRHLPVLEGETLVGILSSTDIKHAVPSPLIEGNKEEYDRVLNTTPVSRVMRRHPISVAPDATLAEVVRLMVENKVGAVLVVEDGKLVGIVSELDVLRTFRSVLEILE